MREESSGNRHVVLADIRLAGVTRRLLAFDFGDTTPRLEQILADGRGRSCLIDEANKSPMATGRAQPRRDRR